MKHWSFNSSNLGRRRGLLSVRLAWRVANIDTSPTAGY
jgi:hypothetical protein